jgi:hypothetical protein
MRLAYLVVALAGLGCLCVGCADETFFKPDGAGFEDSYLPSWDSNNGVPTPTCPGQEATVTGTALAPNGADPVPGASVFIPAKVPELFPPDVKCEVCGHLGKSNNLWYTTSAPNGSFTLKNVCPGKWPLVVQNGRFRRLVYINVAAGSTMAIPAGQSRLPRRHKEFVQADSIPKIAVATGDFDKMECVLRKMGLADGTFDLYEAASSRKSPKTLPSFKNLVADLNKMKSYNIIFINCTANTFEKELANATIRKNLNDYVNAGGRLYVTDWSYDWIEQVEPFSPFIDFEPGASPNTPEPLNAAALGADGLKVTAKIKDPQMAQWLTAFPGAISGGNSHIEHFLINWVIMHKLGQGTKLWVEGSIKSSSGSLTGTRPLTVTFNFKNCGKVLYSSYHTEGREDESVIAPKAFPAYCGGTFSPQDRILEYLIFDIASCIKPVE